MQRIIAHLLLVSATAAGFAIGAELIPSPIGTAICIIIGSSFAVCMRD